MMTEIKYLRPELLEAIARNTLEQVQQLLGHQSIDTTLHYAMVNQVNVKNSCKKFIG